MSESRFEHQLEELIRRARQASTRAVSYRDFRVGCAVLAENDRGRTRRFLGANAKPIADGPKICAEQVAVMAAVTYGYDRIIGMVVAGDPQPDGRTGIQAPTLHPCWHCRQMLGSLPNMRAETIVVTVHNHSGPMERHTWGDLIAHYAVHPLTDV